MSTARPVALVVALATLGCASLLGPGIPGEGDQTIVVAVHDLSPGHTIGEGDVSVQFMASERVPDGVLTAEEAAVGRTVAHPIPSGWMVRVERLDGLATNREEWTVDDPMVASLLRGPAVVDVVWMRSEGGPCLAASAPGVAAEGAVVLAAEDEVLRAARAVPAEARRLVVRWTDEARLSIPECEEAG